MNRVDTVRVPGQMVIIPSFGFLTHDYYWRFKIGFIWLNWRVAIGIAKRRGGE